MKTLKAFIKPLETAQRSVKIIQVIHEAVRVKDCPNKDVSHKNLDKSVSLIIQSKLPISRDDIDNLMP